MAELSLKERGKLRVKHMLEGLRMCWRGTLRWNESDFVADSVDVMQKCDGADYALCCDVSLAEVLSMAGRAMGIYERIDSDPASFWVVAFFGAKSFCSML
jgi:hypothetical protein